MFLRFFRLNWELDFLNIRGTFFLLNLGWPVHIFVWIFDRIKIHEMRWRHFQRFDVFMKLLKGSWVIRWVISKSWWWNCKLMLNWKLNGFVSMRSMDHTSSNCLLFLEVIFFNFTLRDFSHELEVHEATLGISVGLSSHESHCLFVVFIVRGLTMHWTLLDGSAMSL